MAEGIFSPGVEQGSQFVEGRGWVSLSREHVKAGNRGWVLVTCPLKFFEKGVFLAPLLYRQSITHYKYTS